MSMDGRYTDIAGAIVGYALPSMALTFQAKAPPAHSANLQRQFTT